jgi:hypothetical protein
MVKLYDYGYDLGRAGYRWQKVPPGFEETVSGAATSAAADAAATAPTGR